jgi:hypothetical protein
MRQLDDGSNTNDTNNSKDASNVGIPLAERTSTAIGTRAATAETLVNAGLLGHQQQ